MSSQKRFKSVHYSQEQKEMLIQLIGRYPRLNTGKFSADFTLKQSQTIWENIAQHLNAIVGAKKEWKQWRKTWQDIKCHTKAKRASILKEQNKTGGGPTPIETLTTSEEQVLDMINPALIMGLSGVKESCVQDFNLDSETDKEKVVASSSAIIANTQLENNAILDHNYTLEYTNQPPSTSKQNRIKCSSAARRSETSATATETSAEISKSKLDIKKEYYERKLVLLEQQVIALENIVKGYTTK